jgi:spore photoproduct lyase
VLVTPGALGWEHGRGIADRAAALGCEVVELRSDRLPSLTDDNPRQLYREAKSTLAVIVASPSRRRPQPIPPSADWRFDLAEGCPAHCHYCYLAGSLKGPPITRVYANLPELLAELPALLGAGTVTSRSPTRAQEGTTFEASCYTDPLGIEHLTGSLAATVRHFGAWQAPVQLRLTTKFDAIDPLLGVEHHGRTRVRFSVNAAPLARRLEGGTASLPARLAAMRRLALAGYPIGLTVAPVMPVDGWREAYDALFADAATALTDVPALDLTAEFITHRFTSTSKEVLLGWYPGTPLEMDEAARVRKTTRFGSTKHVYPAATMRELRGFLEEALARRLPSARVLYWA